MATARTYKGFEIRNKTWSKGYAVYDPRFPKSPLQFANTLVVARGWIQAYRNGATWAVLSILNADERA